MAAILPDDITRLVLGGKHTPELKTLRFLKAMPRRRLRLREAQGQLEKEANFRYADLRALPRGRGAVRGPAASQGRGGRGRGTTHEPADSPTLALMVK